MKQLALAMTLAVLSISAAHADTLSFTVRVDSYDPQTRSMNVTFIERSQVMPGTFVQAGSQGLMGVNPMTRMPSTLKSGDIVRVNRELKDGEFETTSVVLVKNAK